MGFVDLFRPKWKHSNSEIRLATVKRLTDMDALGWVVENDKEWSVLEAAVERLTELNEQLHPETWANRLTRAVDNLTDQVLLAELAKKIKNSDVRQRAVARLTDQSVLVWIAKNDEKWNIRYTAVTRLTDQVALAEVAKSDEAENVFKKAVEMLTDQVALTGLVKNHRNALVRKAAVERVASVTVRTEVALGDPDAQVRKKAIECISQDDVLAKIARAPNADPTVVKLAMQKVRDVSLINDIAPLYLRRRPEDWDAECIRSALLNMCVVQDDGERDLGCFRNVMTDENELVRSKEVKELPLAGAVEKIDKYWSKAKNHPISPLSYSDEDDGTFKFRETFGTPGVQSINVVRIGQHRWKVCEYDRLWRS